MSSKDYATSIGYSPGSRLTAVIQLLLYDAGTAPCKHVNAFSLMLRLRSSFKVEMDEIEESLFSEASRNRRDEPNDSRPCKDVSRLARTERTTSRGQHVPIPSKLVSPEKDVYSA